MMYYLENSTTLSSHQLFTPRVPPLCSDYRQKKLLVKNSNATEQTNRTHPPDVISRVPPHVMPLSKQYTVYEEAANTQLSLE